MSEEFGTGISFQYNAGFVDYAWRFPSVQIFWVIIGAVFFVVSFISFLPQPIEIFHTKSSYGLEPLSSFCANLGEFLVIYNLLCFKSFDFVGFLQYHSMACLPRILAFLNLFFSWVMNIPEVLQIFIFHDREYRESRNEQMIRKDWIKSVFLACALGTIDIALFSILIIISLLQGFERTAITSIGEICGTVATVLEFSFFVPQMYTTCKLQDGGSLSLLMLEIQGPADIANALYMWLGTGDHWTTWLTLLVGGIENLVLLATCLVFKCLKQRKLKALEQNRIQSMSLNASLEPEPLFFEKF